MLSLALIASAFIVGWAIGAASASGSAETRRRSGCYQGLRDVNPATVRPPRTGTGVLPPRAVRVHLEGPQLDRILGLDKDKKEEK